MLAARPLFALVALAFALAGCAAAAPPQPKLPQLSFTHLAPFKLDVGRLELVTEYKAPGVEPNIEHLMALSPEAAAQKWAQDRLQPIGRTGSARFIIRDAKAVEVPLHTDKGFTGLFKKEQAERYEMTLDVAFQILDERQFPVAEVVAQGSRSRTAPEGMTLNDRDRIWHEMVESLINDVNGQLDGTIRQYMARWMM